MTIEMSTSPPIDEFSVQCVEFISVPEWCRRVGCSMDAGYRAARRNEIAGLFRIGRLMRVNWQAFVMATYNGTAGAAYPGCSAPRTSAA